MPSSISFGMQATEAKEVADAGQRRAPLIPSLWPTSKAQLIVNVTIIHVIFLSTSYLRMLEVVSTRSLGSFVVELSVHKSDLATMLGQKLRELHKGVHMSLNWKWYTKKVRDAH